MEKSIDSDNLLRCEQTCLELRENLKHSNRRFLECQARLEMAIKAFEKLQHPRYGDAAGEYALVILDEIRRAKR